MSTPITLQPGTLPVDCYPPLPQTLYELMVAATVAELDQDFPGIVVGPDEPAPEYQDRVWFRTTDLQWYYYSGGQWVRPYPVPASGQERRLWVGAESDVWSYDGGSGDDPAVVIPILASGAMWEVDHNFDGRFPLGPGTLPSTTVVAVTNTGGEEKHVLTIAELARHRHVMDINWDSDAGQGGICPCEQGYSSFAGGEIDGTLNHGDINGCTSTEAASYTGSDTAHNTMPPYYGVFFIKRTARTLVAA